MFVVCFKFTSKGVAVRLIIPMTQVSYNTCSLLITGIAGYCAYFLAVIYPTAYLDSSLLKIKGNGTSINSYIIE